LNSLTGGVAAVATELQSEIIPIRNSSSCLDIDLHIKDPSSNMNIVLSFVLSSSSGEIITLMTA
jgi:hypothetical protein